MLIIRCLLVVLLVVAMHAPTSAQRAEVRHSPGTIPAPAEIDPPGAERWAAGILGAAAGAGAGWYFGGYFGGLYNGPPCDAGAPCEQFSGFDDIGRWVGATLFEAVAVPLAISAVAGGDIGSATGPSLLFALVGLTGGALIYEGMDSLPLALGFSGAILLTQIEVVSKRLRR